MTPDLAQQAQKILNEGLRITAADEAVSFGTTSTADTARIPLLYLDPLFDQILLMFPQDNLRELYRRLRHYYKYDPYVKSIIDFHTETPISDFELRCPNHPKAQAYFNDFKERKNLFNMCVNLLRDYWLLGESEIEGAQILMSDGTERSIENIRAGDEIISHTGYARTVIMPTMHKTDETMYGLQIRGNGKMPHWFTGKHPILIAREIDHSCRQGFQYRACIKPQPCQITARGRRRINGTRNIWKYDCRQHYGDIDIKYIPANTVRQGDYTVLPQYQEESNTISMDFARLLGYYASEGSRQPYGLVISNTDKEIVSDIIDLIVKLTGVSPHVTWKSDRLEYKPCARIRMASSDMASKIKKMCPGIATNKILSEEILQWPNKAQIEFLKSFTHGNGWVDDGHVVLCSSSKDLASQLYHICVKNGMSPSRCQTTKTSELGRTIIHQIKLSKSDSIHLKEEWGKLAKIRDSQNNDHFSFFKNGMQFKQVTDVKKKHHKGTVYSLEVDKDNSYISEGIAVHNSFYYGNWDSNSQEYSEFVQLPPEEVEIRSAYVIAKRSYTLRPNREIAKLLRSNSPSDRALAEIIQKTHPDHTTALTSNKPFPIDASRLIVMQREMSGYSNRGVSPVLSVVKDLMFQDFLNLFRTVFIQRHSFPLRVFKIGSETIGYMPSKKMLNEFRCFSSDTEILTADGFKLCSQINTGDSVATFNPNTEHLEYHSTVATAAYDYNDKMINFKTPHCDMLVTPNHKLWTKPSIADRGDWSLKDARDVHIGNRFRSITRWSSSSDIALVNIGEYNININDMLQLAGYYISEGHILISKNPWTDKGYETEQNAKSDTNIQQLIGRLPFEFGIRRINRNEIVVVVRVLNKATNLDSDKFNYHKFHGYSYNLTNKDICNYFINNFGHYSYEKHIPTWVKMLPCDQLKILLDAMIEGDGSRKISNYNKNIEKLSYHTTSKQLADDVQEICLKLGYYSSIIKYKMGGESSQWKQQKYTININTGDNRKQLHGAYPGISSKNNMQYVPYNGKVYCIDVPPYHLLFARRNGKVVIAGNSQLIQSINDPNFNLITHPLVQIETHTGQDKILPLIPYYELVKGRILTGLGVSEALISGEKTPYASAVTFMRGLMNKYLTVRNNLENELRNKIFRPMSAKLGFFDEQNKPIVPAFFWQKANLLSSQAIQTMLVNLRDKGELPMRYISEIFGFELKDIVDQMKVEEGTRTDPVWRDLRKSRLEKSDVAREAYLQGHNFDEAIKQEIKQEIKVGKVPESESEPKFKLGKLKGKTPVIPSKKLSVPTDAPVSPKPEELKEEDKSALKTPEPPETPVMEGVGNLPGEERRPRPGETSEGTPKI